MMTRRNFFTSAAAAGAVSIIPLTLTGCSTDWITTAIADLPTIEEILSSLTAIVLDATGNGLLDPIAQGVIDAAIAAAGVALSTVQSVFAAYKANPSASTLADVENALIAAQGKLSAILAAAQIKNPALINTITGAVNIAISVLASIQLLIPNSKAAARYKRTAGAVPTITLPKPNDIIGQYNVIVNTNGFSKHHLHKHLLGR